MFLQHPRERDVAIGTARMAHLALEGSLLLEGIALDAHPVVEEELAHGGAAVLFPGEDARPLEDWLAAPPRTLFVVDGTWSQAKKLLKLNPGLAALPRLSYRPPAPGNYRIRKEPSDECLATIEAVAAVLGALEGDVERFRALLAPFEYMVDRQLEAAQRSQGIPRHRRRRPLTPQAALPELLPLLERPERAVLLYGEANSQARGTRTPGVPELIHLVALRPATGELFEAILAPRRPLGDDTARHLGLDAAELLGGGPVAPALARFRSFLGEGAPVGAISSQLCAWGPYPRDLLMREGEPMRGFVDLRALAARAWGRCGGGIPGRAEQLGVANAPRGRGRAGSMLGLLAPIYDALVTSVAPRAREDRASS